MSLTEQYIYTFGFVFTSWDCCVTNFVNFQLVLFLLNDANIPTTLNPLSSNSDQRQISPCNISIYSTPEVMRIKDIITQGDILTTSPSTFITKVWGQDRRICSLMLGVKGLNW